MLINKKKILCKRIYVLSFKCNTRIVFNNFFSVNKLKMYVLNLGHIYTYAFRLLKTTSKS